LSFWESPSEVHRRSAVQQCFYHQIIQIWVWYRTSEYTNENKIG
jgi:hypothetical protein